MEALLQDLRYAARRLHQSPGFTAVAVAIIALGIGANAAIFSIVDAVLFRPQPYERPGELISIYTTDTHGRHPMVSSYPDYLSLREQTDLFSGTTAFEMKIMSRITEEGSEVVMVESVAANYWEVLGLRPFRGRAFNAADDVSGSAPVAVINHQAWERKFGSDPSIIGRTVNLNGTPVTIVGIGPDDYSGFLVGVTSEYWVPYGSLSVVAPDEAASLERRGARSLMVRARLRPGVGVERARAGVALVMTRLAREYPQSNEGREALVFPTSQVRFLPEVDQALFPVAGLLMAVVGLVLAVACSNLANLLLARGASRQREVAIRLAMGAGRGRLVRQLLAESMLLAAVGGAAGLGLAYWLVRAIVAFRPPIPFPLALDLTVDTRVLAFTAVLSLLTGGLFGFVPALRASRPDLVRALKNEDTALAVGHRRFGLRNTLVVSQVAVSLLLLVCAGLFVRSLGNAARVEPGFEAENVAMISLRLGQREQSDPAAREFLRAYLARLASRRDIRSLAVADLVPLGFGVQAREISIDGYAPPPGEDGISVDYAAVDSGYFRTLGIPLLRGRGFTGADDATAPRVVAVSEAMALRFWGTREVVGRRFRLEGSDGGPVEIVGVTRDTKVRTLGEAPRPHLYVPFEQNIPFFTYVIAATAGDPGPVLEGMRRELRAMNAPYPVFEARTMPQHLGIMLFAPRMGAALLSVFGILAVVLAALGLYGVVAFGVSQRTREIAIRMAIGARPGQVVGLVVSETMVLVGVGFAIGMALAALATRPLASLLYGVGPSDPFTYGAVGLLLAVVALGAAYLPARAAAAVDPMAALKNQ
jgi:predicted permease